MKKTILCNIHLLIGFLVILVASCVQAQEIPVKVTGLRSGKGNILINVFKDQADYDQEIPFKKFSFDKKNLDKNMIAIRLNLEPGIYGITMVDDENGNGKIDKNFVGMPKEGFGFSNFFMEKMKKPTFNDFKIDLKNQSKIEIRVKYM